MVAMETASRSAESGRTAAEEEAEARSKLYISRRSWQIGFLIYLLGQVLTMTSMSLAPQSLIAVLGSSSLVFNGFLSPMLLGEVVTNDYVVACIMIMGGAGLVAYACPHNNQTYSLEELVALSAHPAVKWFFGIAAVCLGICFFLRYYFRPSPTLDDIPETTASRRHFALLQASTARAHSARLMQMQAQAPKFKYGSIDDLHVYFPDHPDSDEEDTDLEFHAETYNGEHNHPRELSGPKQGESYESYQMSDPAGSGLHQHFDFRTSRTGSLQSDDFARKVVESQATSAQMAALALVAATIAALWTSCSVLLAKCIAQLIKSAYVNQSITAVQQHPGTWTILAVFTVSALGSVHYMNVALTEAPAIYVYPFYYALSTSLTVASGFIYFQEYAYMSTFKLVVFFTGLFIAISGTSFATASVPNDTSSPMTAPTVSAPAQRDLGLDRDEDTDENTNCVVGFYRRFISRPLAWIAYKFEQCTAYLFYRPTADISDLQQASEQRQSSERGGLNMNDVRDIPLPDLARASTYETPAMQRMPSLVEYLENNPLALGYAALNSPDD